MYHLIRRIHLFTGLVILVFILMYFVSGYVMIHEPWFHRGKPIETTRDEVLAYRGPLEADALGRFLEHEYGLRGRRQPPTQLKDGSWDFRYTRPGVNFRAVVAPKGDRVKITKSEFDAVGLVHGYHRLHGYGGGWFYDLWAVLYDVASAALIVSALTGIYLWYKLTPKRLLGWVVLAVSFGYAAVTVLYLVYRR